MSKTAICPFCGKRTDRWIMFNGDIVGCRYCGIHKKETNADKIRAMTVEEMAEFMTTIGSEYPCPKNGFWPCKASEDFDCKKCWLEWLKQEV